MTRLVARLVLAMLLLPCTGALILLFVMMFLIPSGGPPPISGLVIMWAVVYAFIAAYWVLLWRDMVRWTRQRVVATVVTAPATLLAGAFAGGVMASLPARPPVQVCILVGGGLVPIIWVLATVLIWRETPRERVERLSLAGTDGVCCPVCGYNMTGLHEARCPECGARFTLDQLISTQPRKERDD